VFKAYSGFGGAEYLLPGLVTEGRRRGLDLGTVARLVSFNPAQRFGFGSKGLLAEGYDADIALVRLDDPWTVHAEDSHSTQGYTPFENFAMDAKVVRTLLRGRTVYVDGEIVGQPGGRYVHRPTPVPTP
jgi:allantoinase